MILKIINFLKYSLLLKNEFRTAKFSIKKRDVFIIKGIDEFNNYTYGEAAPFPYLSIENNSDVERELNLISKKNIYLDENLYTAKEQIKNLCISNSTRFALEQIYINLLFKENKINIKAFSKSFKNVINVNAIIDISDKNNALKIIQQKYNDGYKSFKIKIDKNNFKDIILLLDYIRSKFDDNITIRLDANGIWDLNEAKSNLNILEQFNIEYIEEPCNSLKNNIEIQENTSINIALDESLKNIEETKNIIINSKINFIILKPSIYGNIIDVLNLIDYAESRNKNIIISSALESSIGKSALVLLSSYSTHNYAHGLDTSTLFIKNTCEDFYKVRNGKVYFNISNYPPDFNINL